MPGKVKAERHSREMCGYESIQECRAARAKAIADCQKLIDRLHGDGWVGRVLENLDWHFEARNGPMVVSNMSHRNSILWFAEPLAPGSDCGYDGKMMLRKSFKDPNKAVQAAIEHITQKLEELNAHYGQLERLIK